VTRNTRFPNLFIVGAPKCDTTALSHYLAGHPQIFMTEIGGQKETMYFVEDMELSFLTWRIRDEDSYLRLFDTADPSASYWGEASVFYLFSAIAIPRILQKSPDARLIVMLRNPVDLAHSLHNEYAKCHGEILDFETAWRLQASRTKGQNLPARFSDGDVLQYGAIAKTGTQLERMLKHVDRSQVHIILYDDFSANPAASYAALLDWLGLAHDGQALFEKINPSVVYRSRGLEYAFRAFRTLRGALRLPARGLGIHALVDRFNKKNVREPLRRRSGRNCATTSATTSPCCRACSGAISRTGWIERAAAAAAVWVTLRPSPARSPPMPCR
jgi:hypothetical protein